MARVLLIDDDPALLDALCLALEDAGHSVATAADGVQGHQRLRAERPDIVVSDVNMPGLDGFSLCRRMRADGDDTPLVLLTARDSEIDEALGLELGADDYVSKPFSSRVLLSRVAALLRRAGARAAAVEAVEALVVGPLSVFEARLELRWRGVALVTTVTEFRLVAALAARPGVVFSRERLLAAMRDDDSIVVDRIVDTYVRRLRRKFEAIDAGFAGIETLVGAGYRWRDTPL